LGGLWAVSENRIALQHNGLRHATSFSLVKKIAKCFRVVFMLPFASRRIGQQAASYWQAIADLRRKSLLRSTNL
jgi:hypothetical protein